MNPYTNGSYKIFLSTSHRRQPLEAGTRFIFLVSILQGILSFFC